MRKSAKWVINSNGPASGNTPAESLVMAWARDISTGEPVYVMELDKAHRGALCGCECLSCQLPLTAVNVAKTEYVRRPHFRHPHGAEKNECMYLSARLAALQLLKEQGFLLLPRRQISGRIEGISGTEHKAWAEQPAERVRIRNFDFQDRIAAVLTLDDGRQLRVQLIGTAASLDSDGFPIPTILLDVNDPTVASMSPEALRVRIKLAADNVCWLSHWNDQVLQRQAEEEARLLADDLMDLTSAYSGILDGIDAKFRRETVLHLEVKMILAESKEIRVPALQAKALKISATGESVTRYWEQPSLVVPLLDVQLEQSFGRVIPDVAATVPAEHGNIMMIEVTVTNRIDDERLTRIRQRNVQALEIDLSHSGGMISREELKTWVVHGLNIKRWLHHPSIEMQTASLQSQVEAAVAVMDSAEYDRQKFRSTALGTPLKTIVKDFLDAVADYAQAEAQDGSDDFIEKALSRAKENLSAEARKLAAHAYPEAEDMLLIGGREGIIARLLSITRGKGVGFQLDSIMEVISDIRQSKRETGSNYSLYLIAEKAYRQADTDTLPDWYKNWTGLIREKIKQRDAVYFRDAKFDRLLSLLFPKMVEGLAHGFGTVTGPTRRRDGSSLPSRSTTNTVRRIRDDHADGAYRNDAPRIIFDDVLKEAEATNSGEGFPKWFRIWNDRYALKHQLQPIAEVLTAAGFVTAMDEWYKYDAYVKRVIADGIASMQLMQKENALRQSATSLPSLAGTEGNAPNHHVSAKDQYKPYH